MDINQKIQQEFQKVLKLPISNDEAKRYREHLLRQHPGHDIVKIEDLYKMAARQAMTFTPAQILRLWEKSNNLILSNPRKYSRRQELSELLACALFAEYLNNSYIISNIPQTKWYSALFVIQAVPKELHLPDVFIYSRSHRNRLIPNNGSNELQKIEVLEYEQHSHNKKISGVTLEDHISSHLIDHKINKVDNKGLFPYSEDTRLLMLVDTNIDISNVNFLEISERIIPTIEKNKASGFGHFPEIHAVKYVQDKAYRGEIFTVYPEYKYSKIPISNSTENDYNDPIFEIN